MNKRIHRHALLLTLQEDLTLLLQCLIPANVNSEDDCGNLDRVISPLYFPLCAEMGQILPLSSSEMLECDCEEGPRIIHPENKVSYTDIQKQKASVIETNFYNDEYLVCLFSHLTKNM